MKIAQDLGKTDVGQDPAPGDAEIKASVNLCRSVDEVMSALALYPGAIGMESIKPSDTELTIGSLCSVVNLQISDTSPVCTDAKKHDIKIG